MELTGSNSFRFKRRNENLDERIVSCELNSFIVKNIMRCKRRQFKLRQTHQTLYDIKFPHYFQTT